MGKRAWTVQKATGSMVVGMDKDSEMLEHLDRGYVIVGGWKHEAGYKVREIVGPDGEPIGPQRKKTLKPLTTASPIPPAVEALTRGTGNGPDPEPDGATDGTAADTGADTAPPPTAGPDEIPKCGCGCGLDMPEDSNPMAKYATPDCRARAAKARNDERKAAAALAKKAAAKDKAAKKKAGSKKKK